MPGIQTPPGVSPAGRRPRRCCRRADGQSSFPLARGPMLASGLYPLASWGGEAHSVVIVTPQTFIQSMRQLASGVTLITTAH